MARRRQSALENLIELAALMPWWAGAAIALVSYIIIHPFAVQPVTVPTEAGQLGQAMSRQLIRTFAIIGQYAVPAAFLLGAVISALRRAKRKRLFETTADVTTPNATKSLSWQEFEMLVGEVFRRDGYVVRETPDGADGGIDLELSKDGELTLVQCKQWRATKVGVSIIRELFGVMAARGVVAAYVITSGAFTKDAQKFAEDRNVTLIDGDMLDAMIHKVRTTTPITPTIPRSSIIEVNTVTGADADIKCPRCGGTMVKRMARKGPTAGQAFWGCSNYPKCRGTLSIHHE